MSCQNQSTEDSLQIPLSQDPQRCQPAGSFGALAYYKHIRENGVETRCRSLFPSVEVPSFLSRDPGVGYNTHCPWSREA